MKADCEPKKYETTKARLISGDNARLLKVCEKINKIVLERDGFLKQGVNRANISDAISALLDLEERVGLQSAKASVQLTLHSAGLVV